MTFIISARTGPFVAQVSDCRVTIRGRSKVHSDIENKAIVFRAADGIAALGYSGNAYIGALTTDEWLAQSITGIDMRGSLLYSGAEFLHHRTIGDILHKLRCDIQGVVRSENSFRLELVVSGYRQHKRALNSFVVRFGHVDGTDLMPGTLRLPRTFLDARGLQYSMIGDRPTYQEINARLPTMLPSPPASAEDLANALKILVRERADTRATVGKNLMSICIDGLQRTVVHRIDLGSDVPNDIDVPLTPWVCGMTSVHAPGNLVDVLQQLGDWKVTSTSDRRPVSTEEIPWTFSVQRSSRKPKPS